MVYSTNGTGDPSYIAKCLQSTSNVLVVTNHPLREKNILRPPNHHFEGSVGQARLPMTSHSDCSRGVPHVWDSIDIAEMVSALLISPVTLHSGVRMNGGFFFTYLNIFSWTPLADYLRLNELCCNEQAMTDYLDHFEELGNKLEGTMWDRGRCESVFSLRISRRSKLVCLREL